ncbi:MAG: peptide ABC transporter substrate-binding protein [Deltaproteobacteria bacterium]|nr:peptide ABC transporter substrate-binding protein [Deltaproteobacteria bacterium]
MRRAALLVLLTATALSTSFCKRQSDRVSLKDASASSKVFGVAMWEPETIDPSLAAEEAGVTLARGLFEGLLNRPAGDGPMVPGVASSWMVSKDGLTWTFHLRPDARWSDGRPVTSGDFVYGLRRVLDPTVGSRNAALLFFIEGAQEFNGGDAKGPAITAPDPATLVIRLHSPVPYFTSVLTYPAYFPIRKDVIEDKGIHWTRPGAIVSNGAFLLKEFEPGVKAVLVKNPDWWNAGSVALDGAVFYFVENDRLAFDWFRTGRVQWLKGTLNRDQIPIMRRTRPAEFHTDPVLCTYYAVMRSDRPPLDDPRLRRALNLGVDKERLVREVLMGGQGVASGLVPPAIKASTGYDPPKGEQFDPVAARALVTAYIAEKGDVPQLTYIYNSGQGHRLVALFLQSEWKRNLGLDVRLRATEWKTLLSRVRKGAFQIARASWCADYVDPGNFLDVFRGGGPNNYPRFESKVYDDLLSRARRTADWKARLGLYREAEQILNRGAPIVPLYFYTRIYMLSTAVTGFKPNLLDVHPLEYLDLRPRNQDVTKSGSARGGI